MSTARVSVPAPTCISGTERATAEMAGNPAECRKVISMASIPPANKACAKGTA